MNTKHILQVMSVVFTAVWIQGCYDKVETTFNSSTSGSETTVPASSQGTAILEWSAPTQNDDGSALTDLSGYKIRYGTAPGVYTSTINTGNVTTYTVQNLEPGKKYYFTVTAVNSTSDESPASNEASKQME